MRSFLELVKKEAPEEIFYVDKEINPKNVLLLEAGANEDFAYELGVQCEEGCEESSPGQSQFAWEVWQVD